MTTELENKAHLESLLDKKDELLSKKRDLKNRMNLLQREVQNIEKKFQATEDYQIKENKKKLEYLRENTKYLSNVLERVEEENDPLEFKNKHKRKI